MSDVVAIVEGMIDIIDKNLIAKTNTTSDVLTGDIMINVENAFHLDDNQEIVLIDYDYNIEGTPHYHIFEYATIQEVNNTHWITLTAPVESNWLVSKNAFVQKTIGSSPLYTDLVLYGDRSVIPTTEIAITVEPLSVSNEWIYIHGGLSEEYRISIMIYGKDIETEQGMKILNKYTDAVYNLFNKNIHIDVDNYDSPILYNVPAGQDYVIVEDTPTNRQYFRESIFLPDDQVFEIQDNMGIEIDMAVTKVEYATPFSGQIKITLSRQLNRSYSLAQYGVFRRHGMYFYDSRIDNVEYGMVQKGSAYVRAARLNWFGKKVTEFKFPQKSQRAGYFNEIDEGLISSSSSSYIENWSSSSSSYIENWSSSSSSYILNWSSSSSSYMLNWSSSSSSSSLSSSSNSSSSSSSSSSSM